MSTPSHLRSSLRSPRQAIVAAGLAGLVAAALFTSAGTNLGAASRVSGVVVFGTSLSDPGNAFALQGGVNVPPDYFTDPLLVPDRPYARGGHHFTDGPTWIEQLAQMLALGGDAGPAFANANPDATNYAIGATRARAVIGLPTLALQVAAYLNDSGGVALADRWHVIEMGANDVRDALVAFPGGATILPNAATAIGDAIETLYAAGARKFLVWTSPNIAITPALRQLALVNPGIAVLATNLTATFNMLLAAEIASVGALPNIQIVVYDSNQTLSGILADAASFGFTNVTSACITPSQPPFFCQEPSAFMFWDGIHPSRATHAIIAQDVLALLPQ